MSEFYIFCNGKSAKDFPFESLKGKESLLEEGQYLSYTLYMFR